MTREEDGAWHDRGRIEAKTRADIGALMTAHPMGEALAEVAYTLAARLDAGVEDKALPGVARELRSHLVELARLGVPDDDGFEAGLSRPALPPAVGDPENPGPGDPGSGGR